MNTHTLSLVLAGLTLCALSGCSKHEDSTAPTAPVADVQKPTPLPPTPDTNMTQAVQQQADTIKQNSDAAVAKAQEQAASGTTTVVKAASDAQAGAAADSAQAQNLIDKARQLIADKDWQGALKTLTDVSALKLTPDQQKMVDTLKHQAESLAQSSATKSATDAASKALGDPLHKQQ